MKTKILLTTFILAAAIYNADAQTQRHRVRQGVRSGELTKGEVKEIREDKKDVRQDVKLAKADGSVSTEEKKIIRKERRKVNHEIYRKKHN